MLQRIEIRGYQSLDRVDIPLGVFTVITGPTGSGKSAVIRAVRLLARNARGTGYITAGRATCSVSAGDGRVVAGLTRSRARRGDAYRLAALAKGQWVTEKYTKLGGQVPEAVASALGLSDLNFAGQLDAPFLLDVSGAELARALGELTNVSMVLAAVADASRCRRQLARDLEVTRERRDALLSQAQAFAGLQGRGEALTSAEEALERAQATSARLARLNDLTGRLAASERAASAAAREAERREPPSLARLEELSARLRRLAAAAGRLGAAEEAELGCGGDAAAAARQAGQAEQAVRNALNALGRCPTCGSIVS